MCRPANLRRYKQSHGQKFFTLSERFQLRENLRVMQTMRLCNRGFVICLMPSIIFIASILIFTDSTTFPVSSFYGQFKNSILVPKLRISRELSFNYLYNKLHTSYMFYHRNTELGSISIQISPVL
jgi:hypothetical protein